MAVSHEIQRQLGHSWDVVLSAVINASCGIKWQAGGNAIMLLQKQRSHTQQLLPFELPKSWLWNAFVAPSASNASLLWLVWHALWVLMPKLPYLSFGDMYCRFFVPHRFCSGFGCTHGVLTLTPVGLALWCCLKLGGHDRPTAFLASGVSYIACTAAGSAFPSHLREYDMITLSPLHNVTAVQGEQSIAQCVVGP